MKFLLIALFLLQVGAPIKATEIEESTVLASPDEIFFLQRIMEFWKDQDFVMAVNQIDEFFRTFPNSDLTDRLLVLQGDLYSSHGNYNQALHSYQRIQNPEFQDKSLSNRLAALYHLGRYSTLIQQTDNFLQANQNSTFRDVALYYNAKAHFELAKTNSDHYPKAQRAFEKIRDSAYSYFALNALLEIYTQLGLDEEKTDCYLLLSKKFPDKKEHYLFLAAQSQKVYAPKEALKTFLEVRDLRGTLVSQANIERLSLLFNLKLFQEIADETEEFQEWNRAIEGPLAPLLIGRSYYHLARYDDAMACLEPLLKDYKAFAQDDRPLIKSILIPLIFSAHATNDLFLEKQWVLDYEALVGKDENYAEILYAHAITHKNGQHFEEAEHLLAQLIALSPTFEKMEDVMLEVAVLQFKQGHWDRCEGTLLAFLRLYPLSQHTRTIWQYMATVSLRLLEEAEKKNEPLNLHHERLINSFETALSLKSIPESKQNPYFLKLCESLYALNRYEDVIARLSNVEPKSYKMHLLLAGCYENKKDPIRFIEHAEKTLALKPDLLERHQLQQNLFVSYLQKGSLSSRLEEQRLAYQHAAQMLSQICEEGGNLSQEQRKWLAHYYYQKAFLGQPELFVGVLKDKEDICFAKQALEQYELLTDKETMLSPQALFLAESDIFKMCMLEMGLGLHKRSRDRLEHLSKNQSAEPEYGWKWKSRTWYLLGKHYQASKEWKLALAAFKRACKQKGDSLAANAAQLEASRISYQTCPLQNRSLENVEIVDALKSFKDLQMKRVAAQEPIHLEAALDYSDLRVSLEPDENRNELHYRLLKRVKEEFSNQDTIPAKEYHQYFQERPYKKALYQLYMQLIDGHIALVEAKMAQMKQDVEEMLKKKHLALSLYSQLLKNSMISQQEYVSSAVNKGIKEAETL